MKRFKSARQAQRFLSVHDQVANLFHIPYPKSAPADFRRASRRRALPLGARSPRRALLPDPASQKNRLSSGQAFVKLTMPRPKSKWSGIEGARRTPCGEAWVKVAR